MSNKTGHKVAYAKSIDDEKKIVKAHVSTHEWDRTDERFAPGAWNLENFKRNPVVMWGHDYSQAPIGKAINIYEDENGLFAETEFAPDERSQQYFELFKGGFLSAFSVGFNPKKWGMEPIDGTRKGVVYTDAELLEYSAVSIPANPGALISRELADVVKKAFPEALSEMVVDGETKFMVVDPSAKKTADAPDLEQSIKQVIQLVGDARRSRLPGTHLSVLKSAANLFQDILNEHEEGVDETVIAQLTDVVKSYGVVINNLYPDASVTVRRLMNQIDKALARQ